MSTKFRILNKHYPTRPASIAAVYPPTQSSSISVWGWLLLILVLAGWGLSLGSGFINGLTVLAVLSFILTIVGFLSPGVGLLGISMFSTLDALTRSLILSGGLLRWNTFNYWLLVVMLLSIPFLLRLNDIHSRLLQLFGVLLALELILSTSLSVAAQDVLNIATTFGLLVYFARAISDENAWFWMGIVNGVLAAVGGFIYYLQMSTLPYINPNTWAYFPLTALFCICLSFYFVNNHPRGKLILMVLAAVNLVWIFLTGSRGSMLMGLVCLGYLIVSTRSFSWTTLLIGLAVLAGYAATNLMGEQQAYALMRIQKLFDESQTLSQRTSGRSTLMDAGLEVFLDNPLGIGTGNFRYEFSSIDVSARNKPAHSAWIKTLAENGIPGFLLLTGYVGSFLVVGWRKKNRQAFLLGVLATFILAVGFITREFQGKGLWFIAAGATALLHRAEMMEYLKGKVKSKRFLRYRNVREINNVHNE